VGWDLGEVRSIGRSGDGREERVERENRLEAEAVRTRVENWPLTWWECTEIWR
jgi:hypothetical protein